MTLTQLVNQRYTTKAYDAARRISDADIAQLQALLQMAPSSVNSQPWHFVVAASDDAKARIARAGAHDMFVYNAPKVTNASHVVVLCVRQDLDETHLVDVLEQEAADGRFATDDAKATSGKVRAGYVALHRDTLGDLPQWMEKQVYIALGTLLLGAATLGIDTTAMEGLDFAAIDAELGLTAQGYRSLVAVALGYRSDDDFNANLPKSRLSAESVITVL